MFHQVFSGYLRFSKVYSDFFWFLRFTQAYSPPFYLHFPPNSASAACAAAGGRSQNFAIGRFSKVQCKIDSTAACLPPQWKQPQCDICQRSNPILSSPVLFYPILSSTILAVLFRILSHPIKNNPNLSHHTIIKL